MFEDYVCDLFEVLLHPVYVVMSNECLNISGVNLFIRWLSFLKNGTLRWWASETNNGMPAIKLRN